MLTRSAFVAGAWLACLVEGQLSNGTTTETSLSQTASATTAGESGGEGTTVTVPVPSSGLQVIIFTTEIASGEKSVSYPNTVVEGPTTVITAVPNLVHAGASTDEDGFVRTLTQFDVRPYMDTYTTTLTPPPWINSETYSVADTSTAYNLTLTGGATTTLTIDVAFNYSIGGLHTPLWPGGCDAARCIPGLSADDCRTVSFPTHLATLLSETTLTADETLTWCQQFTTDVSGTQGCKDEQTFAGPTTVSITSLENLNDLGIGIRPDPHGGHCEDKCGADFCLLVFPEVFVHYWPPADAHTSCLASNNTTKARRHARDLGANVHLKRVDTNGTAGATTAVYNGYTFTSPSVYVEYPTIMASDGCGLLGSVQTSVTRAYEPNELSTVVYGGVLSSSYAAFDFRDAECLPESLVGGNFWTAIGTKGEYKAIISGPSDLSELDPWWGSCTAAALQGHDPPIALTPAGNMLATPTDEVPAEETGAQPAHTTNAAPAPTVFEPGAKPTMVDPDDSDSDDSDDPEDPAETQVVAEPVKNDPTPVDDAPDATGEPSDSSPPADSNDDSSNDHSSNDDSSNGDSSNDDSSNNDSSNNDSSNGDSSNGDSSNGDTNDNSSNDDSSNNDSSNNDSANDSSNNDSSNDDSSNAGSSDKPTSDGDNDSSNGSSDKPSSGGNNGNDGGDSAGGSDNGTPNIVIGSSTIKIDSPNIVVGDQTFAPGDVATIDDQVVSFPTPNAPAVQTAPLVATIGDTKVTGDSAGNFVVGSGTFSAGQAVTADGQTVVLPTPPPAATSAPLVATIGGTAVSADSASNFVVGSETFAAGATATVDGKTFTLPSAAASVSVIGGSSGGDGEPAVITAGGSVYTANSASGFVIDGETLTRGGVITVDGTPLSLAATSTESADASETDDVGDAIVDQLGGDSKDSTGTAAASSTAAPGAASMIQVGALGWTAIIMSIMSRWL